jgi:hypothetical protein
MVGIDDGEPGPEQCRANAAALGVGMHAEGLQVPDRLLRERPAPAPRRIAQIAETHGGQ